MTIDELAEEIIKLGGREYSHPFHKHEARTFSFRGLPGIPNCECNDRPPELHVQVWRDFQDNEGSVVFEMVAEGGGEWLKMEMYTVKRDKAIDFLPKAQKILSQLWKTYVEHMQNEEPHSDKSKLLSQY